MSDRVYRPVKRRVHRGRLAVRVVGAALVSAAAVGVVGMVAGMDSPAPTAHAAPSGQLGCVVARNHVQAMRCDHVRRLAAIPARKLGTSSHAGTRVLRDLARVPRHLLRLHRHVYRVFHPLRRHWVLRRIFWRL